MEYTFFAKGHENVRSLHKSTFEITTDDYLTPSGDCIIGINSNITMKDFPEEIRNALMTDDSKIELLLETDNGSDIITGYGSSNLTLSHPSDMVCRKSSFTCNRTLMIHADKAAIDLNRTLIDDLKKGSDLKVTIRI
ncbi:MAG: DUF371 domain-containing protein [Methanosphaera sp.]